MARRQATQVDPLTPEQRRLNMSRIRAQNTRPEMIIRRGLHRRGLRFRLHDRTLPGTPDLVFSKARVAIFVHGCFWHGHDCPLGVRPRANESFWANKIERNQLRDEKASNDLHMIGWSEAVVWECALRGRTRLPIEEVFQKLEAFVREGEGRAQCINVSGAR